MTTELLVALAATLVEHENLVALNEWGYDLAHNLRAFDSRSTYSDCAVIVYQQYFLELNCLLSLSVLDVVNEELLPFFCLELLTVNFYDYVHYIYYKNGFEPSGGRTASLPPVTCLSHKRHKSAAKVRNK